MTFQPGDVVALKSGGQPMTVAKVADEGVECIWIGEEGELFRETLPALVLQAADMYEPEDDDEDEAEDTDDAEEEKAEADEDESEIRKIA
jgi:uncharacterized protein YodC (DUF2158 family)